MSIWLGQIGGSSYNSAMETSASPPTIDPELLQGALEALAVLGAAEWALLCRLLRRTAEPVLLAALVETAGVDSSGAGETLRLTMTPEVSSRYLDALEARDFL